MRPRMGFSKLVELGSIYPKPVIPHYFTIFSHGNEAVQTTNFGIDCPVR